MKIVGYIAAGLIGLFLILVVVEAVKGPRTYVEIAHDETQRCIANQGSGTWRASSGVTLQTHCELKATLATLEKQCREHPEGC